MITIKNSRLLYNDFWKSLRGLMEDRSLPVETKLSLVVLNRELSQKVMDIQEAGKGFTDKDKQSLLTVSSQIDFEKIAVNDNVLEILSAIDMMNLEDVITLEG